MLFKFGGLGLALLGIVVYQNCGTTGSIGSSSQSASTAPSSPSVIRDNQRMADLQAVQQALESYYSKNKTYLVTGTGYDNEGDGWLSLGNESGGPYYKSVTEGLFGAGLLPKGDYPDPTQGEEGYMIYLCDSNTTFAISATLENPTEQGIANALLSCNGSGPDGTVTLYGKNYALTGGP